MLEEELTELIAKFVPADDQVHIHYVDGRCEACDWSDDRVASLDRESRRRLRSRDIVVVRHATWKLPDSVVRGVGRVLATIDQAADVLDDLGVDTYDLDKVSHILMARISSQDPETAVCTYLTPMIAEVVSEAISLYCTIGVDQGRLAAKLHEAVATVLTTNLQKEQEEEQTHGKCTSGAEAGRSREQDVHPSGATAPRDDDVAVPDREQAAGVREEQHPAAREVHPDDGVTDR